MSSRISILVLTLISLAGDRQVKSQSDSSYNGWDLVDNAGNIRKPADYRDRYQALGTFSVVDLNVNNELHAVWAPPGTAEYYRKTRKFADGSVLMKEDLDTAHAQLTAGGGNAASGTKDWIVRIKDT